MLRDDGTDRALLVINKGNGLELLILKLCVYILESTLCDIFMNFYDVENPKLLNVDNSISYNTKINKYIIEADNRAHFWAFEDLVYLMTKNGEENMDLTAYKGFTGIFKSSDRCIARGGKKSRPRRITSNKKARGW